MKINPGEPDVRKTMVALERLDLSKCRTVKDIIDGMRLCSFGARMLGSVASTLSVWCWDEKTRPVVIYDGAHEVPTHRLLKRWQASGWCTDIVSTQEYIAKKYRDENVLVIGEYMQRYAVALTKVSKRRIFINQSGQVSPGQYGDGYFPDMVVADPAFIIPVLDAYLREVLIGKKLSVSDFIGGLAHQEGLALEVFHGAHTLLEMVHNPETTVFMTLSGAMTVAKMGLLIDDMINTGKEPMVDYLASTGALMAHGLIEGVGLKHYAYDPKIPDQVLANQHLNRITDSLEPEENFSGLDRIIDLVLRKFDGKRPISPSELHRAIGEYLKKRYPKERAILKSAYEQNVPVITPAFHDSEIGNDVYVHNLWRKKRRKPKLVFDQELDTKLLVKMATKAKKRGIFTIGGGTPRNFTQNVAPLIEIINERMGLDLRPGMFYYGSRTDPAPLWFGNLGGCSYSEGGSWLKFDLNGKLSEIHADATIVWPFVLKYVQENYQGRPWRK